MRLIESLKKKKFILFNTFLTLYIGINLIGGERGLISYFDKKRIQPYRFLRDINEGGYTKNIEILFNQNTKVAKVNN